MSTCNDPTVLAPPSATLMRTVDAIAGYVRRLDAWLVRRQRAARDRLDLSTMSDRELADIGVSRASIDAVADGGWMRDTFR
jgi:uncharacterized protein YjiS (DUF1127 family)